MRDYISEIIEIRNRQGRSPSLEIIRELGRLNDAWQNASSDKNVLRTFVPIRIATIIEVLSRNWISTIIDHGEPFFTRAIVLSKNINLKFDLPLVSAIHGNRITVGELISHNLSYNSLGHIESSFTTILGHKLKSELSNAKVRFIDQNFNAQFEIIITDIDSDCKIIENLFRIRHIIVHEFPETLPASDAEIDEFLISANRIATALDFSCYQLLYGDMPLSQVEMNESAAKAFQKASQEMNDVLECPPTEIDKLELNRSQEKWVDYRNAHCNFVSGMNEQFCGSMAPMLYATEAEKLTKARILQLKSYFNQIIDH